MPGWLATWTRAVVIPAWRRVGGVWIGAAIGGGIVFGTTGGGEGVALSRVGPGDVTALARLAPKFGVALTLMWMLLYLPTARLLVRPETAGFLRSLPHPRWTPRVAGASAFVGLQLPWVVLWIMGAGLRGAAFVALISIVIALVALWQPRPRRRRFPPWTRPLPALRGVYVRALRRRAPDALVRGAGLAILAGLVAGLMLRNDALEGRAAAAFGTGALTVVLVPGWAGALLPLVEAQRASAWLASSLGLSPALRVTTLAIVVTGVYLAGTLIAIVALAWCVAPSTLAWVATASVVTSIGMGLWTTRALVIADRDPRTASVRVVTGAVVAAALAIVALGWLGAVGAPVVAVVGLTAVLSARLP